MKSKLVLTFKDIRAHELLSSLIYETFTACYIRNPDQSSKIKFIGHRIYEGITVIT